MKSSLLGNLAVQAARLPLEDPAGAMLVFLAPADRATAAFRRAAQASQLAESVETDSAYSE